MSGLRRLIGLYTTVCAFGAGTMMAIVFAVIFLNSLGRYLFGGSLPWGEEAPVYLTIYGVMFGVTVGYMQDRHIAFTVVTDLFSRPIRRLLERFVDLAILATGIALAVSGVMFATKRGGVQASGLISSARDLAEATGIPGLEALGYMGTWQAAMPLGGILLTIAALLKLATALEERPWAREA
ncbi:MAG: TRAP transporter small permease subunit [Rhodospirillum sp.]|nr:TRAP transporter small permease subunit [Rhodospirillum sp.]MCF8490644.1 TRAP transporter small permease subunit [Rhodospirillum sp.]MCF8500726.1 TRAP transporter small permease subunit [Rhodospirillum sp.]